MNVQNNGFINKSNLRIYIKLIKAKYFYGEDMKNIKHELRNEFRCAEKVQDSEIVVLDEFCDAVTRPDSLQVSGKMKKKCFFKPSYTKNTFFK